ncbi:MAG TPA: hypothetical protein VN817_00790 [Solirubrobacteraceae bacterium]|nr:hypothetical protein [Solirubrobacteraceae bacterium]
MPPSKPNANVIVRESRGQPFYEAKFRYQGRQVKRRIGPAWIERDPATGAWTRRRGRVPDGAYDERGAVVAAAEDRRRIRGRSRGCRARRAGAPLAGVTFREVAHDYLRWLADVAGAKPSTLRDRESVLGEPGVPRKRGEGTLRAHVMAALGDRPASKITTREVNDVLAAVSATGASASTVNKLPRGHLYGVQSRLQAIDVRAAGQSRQRGGQTPRAEPRRARLLLA